MNDDDQMSVEDAITHIMRVTGKSRRQAKAELVEACRQGKVQVTGINSRTDEREIIPPECFPKVN